MPNASRIAFAKRRRSLLVLNLHISSRLIASFSVSKSGSIGPCRRHQNRGKATAHLHRLKRHRASPTFTAMLATAGRRLHTPKQLSQSPEFADELIEMGLTLQLTDRPPPSGIHFGRRFEDRMLQGHTRELSMCESIHCDSSL